MRIKLLYFVGLCWLLSCNQTGADTQAMQSQLDSLRNRLDHAYKPGLGEFMSDIQVHHEKLWFAGKNENWKLADFEVHEIQEALDDIQNYCQDRPEIQSLPMIKPPLDSVIASIGQKNPAAFKNSFTVLTSSCNNCHRATKHEFNVIKIPDSPPFSNQVFSPEPGK
jgi:hypothetical protein